MGGSTTTVTPQPQQQTADTSNIPNYGALAGQALDMLQAQAPNAFAGAGYQELPQAQLGQVQLGGVNPTLYGNPGSAAAANPSFGQIGSYNEPTGNTNVPAGQTGNSSLGSIFGSLGGLFGGGGIPQQNGNAGQGIAQQNATPHLAQDLGLGGTAAEAAQPNTPAPQAAHPMASQGPIGTLNGPNGQPLPQGQQPVGSATNPGPVGSLQSSGDVPGAPGSFNTQGSPLPSNTGMNPGDIPANSGPGATGVPNPSQGLSAQYRNQFLGANQTSPYYNQAAVAGNVGTAMGQAIQPAANFASSLFGPGLSQMSQDYLQAGAANAGINMQQGIGQLQSQYENDPFNDALGRSEANLISQTANNTLQTASGMGVQQQQIAANQMATPSSIVEQAAGVPVQDAQGLFNTANAAYQAPYQLPLAVLSQTPIASPVVGSTTQTGSKLG